MAYIDRDALIVDLKAAVVEIVFDAPNNQRRMTYATLQPYHLPRSDGSLEVINERIRNVGKNEIPIWDTENRGWFKVDVNRIISAQITNR